MTRLPEKAPQECVDRFHRLAVKVRGMAHNMRPADEDMLQVGLCELWELVSKHGDKPDRYLIKSCRYAMIDHRRKECRREHWQNLREVVSPEGNWDEEELNRLLGILDKRTRAAFVLHVLLDHTTAETADQLATSPRTIERLCQRARKILKKELS